MQILTSHPSSVVYFGLKLQINFEMRLSKGRGLSFMEYGRPQSGEFVSLSIVRVGVMDTDFCGT